MLFHWCLSFLISKIPVIIPTTLNVLWGLNEIIHIIQTLTCNTHPTKGFPGGSVVNNLPANAGDTGDMDLIPGVGRSPGRGNGNPLQYSCLENPMDRAAWRARVLGVTKSQTRLTDEHPHTITDYYHSIPISHFYPWRYLKETVPYTSLSLPRSPL